MKWTRSLAVLWLFAATAIAGTAAHADPATLRTGWVVTPYQLWPILFDHPGVATHLGKSYVYEPVHFQAAASMLPALANGDLDLASLTMFTVANAVQNAKLADLRVIADDFDDGADGYRSGGFMVLKDSPIQKIEDLKGKTIASLGLGSSGDMAIRAMLRSHGVADTAYNDIEVAPPNMKAMLFSKEADLITVIAYDPELEARGRTLFTQRDALGRQASLLVARADFIAKNRPALVDFLADMIGAVRWFVDPKNHQEAVAILARFTKLPPARFDSWAFTKQDVYRDLDGKPDLDALQATFGRMHDMGFLKTDFDIRKYADLSLATEAAKRLAKN